MEIRNLEVRYALAGVEPPVQAQIQYAQARVDETSYTLAEDSSIDLPLNKPVDLIVNWKNTRDNAITCAVNTTVTRPDGTDKWSAGVPVTLDPGDDSFNLKTEFFTTDQTGMYEVLFELRMNDHTGEIIDTFYAAVLVAQDVALNIVSIDWDSTPLDVTRDHTAHLTIDSLNQYYLYIALGLGSYPSAFPERMDPADPNSSGGAIKYMIQPGEQTIDIPVGLKFYEASFDPGWNGTLFQAVYMEDALSGQTAMPDTEFETVDLFYPA